MIDGLIIYKDTFNKKLSTDENFVEGGVRLCVEYGETYLKSEQLVKIIIEIDNEKVYKEFIGDGNKVILSDIKTLICKELNIKPEYYSINKTSYLKDPIKAYKNENNSLHKLGIKDSETIYFQNISAQVKIND